MAPELGLFLDECYYDAYNAQFGQLHGEIHLSEFQDQVDAFKASQLYPHIAARDAEEQVNAGWLDGLTDRYYRFRGWRTAIQSGKPMRATHGERPGTGDKRGSSGPSQDSIKRTRFGRVKGPPRTDRRAKVAQQAAASVSAEFSD